MDKERILAQMLQVEPNQDEQKIKSDDVLWNTQKEKLHEDKEKKIRYYSLIHKLKREKKITDEFELMLGKLSLEEIIGVKLELTSKNIGNKLFNFPIWLVMENIVKEAVLKYAYSGSKTQEECASFLGVSIEELKEIIDEYGVENYFEYEEKKKI